MASGTSRRIGIFAIALIAIIAAALGIRAWKHRTPVIAVAPVVKPAPAKPARPATRAAAAKPKFSRAYMDVIRAAYPGFPATQPLGVPLELSQAAHILLHDQVYLSGLPSPQMWITRADAAPTGQVLKEAADPNADCDVQLVRERVAYVHWMPDDSGEWPPYLVCRTTDGRYEVISAAQGRRPLPKARDYRWEKAVSWNEKVIVPSARGVSIFRFSPEVSESYRELAPPFGPSSRPAAPLAEPCFVLDNQGVVAWMPWENGKTGGRGAARYIEAVGDDPATRPAFGTWTDLAPEAGWPARILHLVPLRDGTVLLMAVDDRGAVQLDFNTLQRTAVKEEIIAKLVEKLGDDDGQVRKKAYDELSQYGSGIWPILEKLLEAQGPEAQARMRQLLSQKVKPTLNGMSLLGDKSLKLVARLADGGTVFYAPAGVAIPNPDSPDETPTYVVPAWIGVRPGQAIELLPGALTQDLVIGKSQLYSMGNDWIVTGDSAGGRWFVGNGFVKLLGKNEQAYSDFIGEDHRGRWLFRKPRASGIPKGAGEAAKRTSNAGDDTLILDPTLPDPTPRLPVWLIQTAKQTGWDRAGWPVAKNVSTYALHENDWVLLDQKEPIYTRPEDVPAPKEPPPPKPSPTTQPAGKAGRKGAVRKKPPANVAARSVATVPATTVAVGGSINADTRPAAPDAAIASTSPAATQPSEPPLLIDEDGNHYFGGLTELRVVSRSGEQTLWPLPASANGKGPAWLVRAPDGHLFLYNQPGRMLRIKPAAEGGQPFAVDATFTHDIPGIDRPTRIWLDPAGRIDMVWQDQLAIFFPAGYIPPSIASKMLNVGG